MKKRIATLCVLLLLLILATVATAQSAGFPFSASNPAAQYVLYPSTSCKGPVGWQVSGTASGGDYRLEAAVPAYQTGSCCCGAGPLLLPLIER